MKKVFTLIASICTALGAFAQTNGWPANYSGVMLQGFYWDSYNQSKWTRLEKRADDFAGYFNLVWVPQSGKTLNATSMGYDPYYYFNQNSSFGTVDELKSMIQTFKNKGIGTIADVVVNHRNTTGWFTFPAETWNGETYQMLSTDIVRNDDGGATLTEANKEGVSLSANNDEGEGWGGMRDLDHKSANVQKIIKAYEKFLVNEIGYEGFRYDMVKGFAGSHVGDYNDAAGVQYSVGECWDSNTAIENWINATGKKSAAFDFQFRYGVRDAINGNDWSKLNSTNNLIHDANYRQYAVTFVENHDMQDRGTTTGYTPDPIKKDTLAANAYLLAMPGTPCVFYTHYLAYPTEIKAMIDARKAAGITNQSNYVNFRSTKAYFANNVTGTKGNLLVYVGSGYSEPSEAQWVRVLNGYHYSYYLNVGMNVPFIDKPSGDYDDSFQATLTAVTNNAGAKVVYTLDGTEPTANSKAVTSGTKVPVNKVTGTTVTLKAGLLVNGAVQNVITRTYNFKEPEQETFETPAAGYTFTAYFIAPEDWEDCKAWAWTNTPKINYTGGQWPGDSEHVYRIKKASDGRNVWQWCYYGTETTTPQYIIFNNGQSGVGVNQTKDLTFTNGGWYQMDGTTTSNPALGINGIKADVQAENNAWYNIAGQRVSTPTQKGLYLHNGKKIVIR